MTRTAVIASITSDIGTALAERWLAGGWTVVGTYRSEGPTVDRLRDAGARLVTCDFSDLNSVAAAAQNVARLAPRWDALIVSPGTLEPVGLFTDVAFNDWAKSITVNFTGQMGFVHGLLPSRNVDGDKGPMVLLFAGGGTNGAPVESSAYTLSKIALIKACELLDAEMPDTRFTIVGPGWVRTKIHDEILRSGNDDLKSYRATRDKLAQNEGFTPMERVLDCIDWAFASERDVIGGRNFSTAHDAWGSAELESLLREDPSMYKLRRQGNGATVGERK